MRAGTLPRRSPATRVSCCTATSHYDPEQETIPDPSIVKPPQEKAVLVSAVSKDIPTDVSEDHLQELASLADTAGAQVVGSLRQPMLAGYDWRDPHEADRRGAGVGMCRAHSLPSPARQGCRSPDLIHLFGRPRPFIRRARLAG